MSTTPAPRPLTRRTLLGGALGLAGAGLLAACGSGNGSQATSTLPAGSSSTTPSRFLVPRFDANRFAVAGAEQRLVFSVLGADGTTPKDLPASLEMAVTKDGAPIGSPVTVAAHDDGIPIAYYPLRFVPPTAGMYTVSATVAGVPVSQAFQVNTTSAVPAVGSTLPSLHTPTTTDPRGVDPICTRVPGACPFHDTDLADALASATPTALLVSTPGYCQIAVCGPVLDLVTEQAGTATGVTVVHGEVYAHPKQGLDELAPLVEGLHLDWEPSLFVVDASGTIVERLDTVFDRTEIAAAFAKLGS